MEVKSVLLLVLALLSALGFLSKRIRNRNKRYPPGPIPMPIVGNLHQLPPFPHISLHHLAKKYGEIMQVKYGYGTVVVASSPRMAEEFLKTHDNVFASRPPLASGKYTGYNFQDLTWAPYGPHWRKARKVFLTELITTKRLDSLEFIRVQERRRFLGGLYAERGKPIVIKNLIMQCTLSSFSRVVFSDKYFSGHKTDSMPVSISEFHGMIDELMVLDGVINFGDWVPWLRMFDLQGYVKRMKILSKKFDTFLDHVIADHLAQKNLGDKNFAPKDMLDVLLQMADESTHVDLNLTMEAVKGLVLDLMAGGTDTSGITMEWVIHELLRHPNVVANMREELDRVIGQERWVQESDYSQMPYLEAIIKETLRLHPIAPLLAPHFAMEDCKVAGYDIAKGTTVLINTWSIGRHPDHWEEPYNFRPERFLEGKDISITGQDFSLLPFGSGRRKCPGYTLGLRLVRTVVGNLFHGFNLKLPEGMATEDICIVERYGLTTCPAIAVKIIPEPRLPAHLYL